jgi:hypothetical protein
LTSQTLPLEIHVKAMTIKDQQEAKDFVQKHLQERKVKLFNDFKSGKISIEDLIDLLFAKQ